MALTKRVEVLLEPAQYALLEEIAHVRKESIASLIRRALERQYLEPTREQKRAALERMLSEEIDLGTWEQIKDDIAKEVVREVEASMSYEPCESDQRKDSQRGNQSA